MVQKRSQERKSGAQSRGEPSLKAARRADADPTLHEEPQIERADVHQHPFEDIGVPPQMHPAHPARLVEMRNGALESFATLAQQPLPPGPSRAPLLGGGLAPATQRSCIFVHPTTRRTQRA